MANRKTDRTPFLMFGRRFHETFRDAIEHGLGGSEDKWKDERPVFEHYACAMFLSGCLAFLESTYGRNAWNQSPSRSIDFDKFLTNQPEHAQKNFARERIGKAGIEALVCIRNAVIHNSDDLSKNTDIASLSKVSAAAITGVVLDGSIVSLISNSDVDFMEYVRLSLVAVAQFHGDG